MPTTDEQVEKKRKDVAALRQQIDDTVNETARKRREKDNDVVMDALLAEETRLKAELVQHQKELDAIGGGTQGTTESVPQQAAPAVAPASSKVADKATDTSTNGKG